MMLRLFSFFLMVAALISCATPIDKETPPADQVFTVTDTIPMQNPQYLLILNSDFNRSYDWGRVSIWDRINKSFVSSVLIGALGGKLALNTDETVVYAVSRDNGPYLETTAEGTKTKYNEGLLHKFAVTYTADKVPQLSYTGNAPADLTSSSTPVRAEPYAMAYDAASNILIVTHLRNGELTLFRSNGAQTDELIGSFKLESGITGIAFDAASGYYLVTHKTSNALTAFSIQAPAALHPTVKTSRVILDLPNRGTDFRDIKPSSEPGVYYLSYRDSDDDGIERPQLVKFRISAAGDLLASSVIWSSPTNFRVGEVAVTHIPDASFELIFASVPGEGIIQVFDSTSGLLLQTIETEDCTPYHLSSGQTAQTGGEEILLVSCFTQDKILAIGADPRKADAFTVREIIE